jgi:hypothetical protein
MNLMASGSNESAETQGKRKDLLIWARTKYTLYIKRINCIIRIYFSSKNMRISALAKTFGASVLCVSMVLSTFSATLADGIQSQWKSRLPQGAPINDTLISGTISVISSSARLSEKESNLIAMIVRRNDRAATRRALIAQSETPQIKAALKLRLEAEKDYVAAMQRSRKAIKMYKVAQARCADLHTHERAVCHAEAQRASTKSL